MLDVEKLKEELNDLEDAELDEEDEERFAFLKALFKALGSDRPDTLIPEDEFKDYIMDSAEAPEQWRAYIDWDRYVDDCRSDYTEIDVDGETYLYQV